MANVSPHATTNLHSVAEARIRMLDAAGVIAETETIMLEDALGRILAEPVTATVNVPPAPNSAMDGYALRSTDLASGNQALPISARIQAGDAPAPLKPGTAARIFTGAIIPEGADAVVMQERTTEQDGQVRIEGSVHAGNNIRRAGEDISIGSCVLEAGTCLRPQHLGLLAAVGVDRGQVVRHLRVALLSTGNELREAGHTLSPGQIYNSNNPMLRGLLKSMGCIIAHAEHVRDTPEATCTALQQAAGQADLIISTGGVSVGDADHIKDAVKELGTLDLWRIAVKPGKPVAFGSVGNALFMGLPGNPVSAWVTFCLFAAPVIRKMQARTQWIPKAVRLPTTFSMPRSSREEYLRVRLEDGELKPYPHQGSGVLSSVSWADGLARVPVDTVLSDGDLVDYTGFEALTS